MILKFPKRIEEQIFKRVINGNKGEGYKTYFNRFKNALKTYNLNSTKIVKEWLNVKSNTNNN